MPTKPTLAYGTWPSPISPQLAASSSRRIGTVQASGATLYWSEARPDEQGRQVIVRVSQDGRPEDVLPKPFSARSRVHEYGGGEFLVSGDTIYFVNDKDQQIYELAPAAVPRRITDEPRTRFADLAHDAPRRRLVAVAELHPDTSSGHALPRNALVAVGLGPERRQVTELAGTRDFYASPRLSPCGAKLAFLAWNLPDMPWDGATLYVAHVRDDGSLGRPKRVAGERGSSVYQPEWRPDGYLYFAWDVTGWGALFRWDGADTRRIYGAEGIELWRPQWQLGTRCFAFRPDGGLVAAACARGMPHVRLGKIAGSKVSLHKALASRAARIDDPLPLGNGFAALVSSPAAMPAVMKVTRRGLKPISTPAPAGVAPGFVSRGQVCAFHNANRQEVFGIYYAPANPLCLGPKGSAPPALVLAHGGPTSMTDAGLRWRVQFYTSRGFAVLDVNYAGSTGYGRAYRNRLDGQWGIADVTDCAAAARHLAHEGLADPGRIAIAGGSAGGYTTLMALATTKAFAAGSSHYGISDLALLLEHTHKFESGYLHRLMGTTPAKWKDTFAARSPINLIDGIAAPVILFQGLDDKVVPPEQSRLIADKLRARGIDVAYHEFAGEGHGFRKSDTIIAVLQAELAFLQRVFSLSPLAGRGSG